MWANVYATETPQNRTDAMEENNNNNNNNN